MIQRKWGHKNQIDKGLRRSGKWKTWSYFYVVANLLASASSVCIGRLPSL